MNKKDRNSLSGIFFENYVAAELVKAGYKLFYWTCKGNSEFEFVIEYDSTVLPQLMLKNQEVRLILWINLKIIINYL